jgi:hypothetical protein
MDENTTIDICKIGSGLLLGFVLGALAFMDLSGAKLEGQAIEKGYATYYEDRFIWKDDLEKRLFLEDLEFFKRNEKMFKKQQEKLPLPGIIEEFN